jgi:serine protease
VDTSTVTNPNASSTTFYARVVYFSGGTGASGGKYAVRLNW